MREVLVDIASKGATILVSSHILGELEKIATHYGIIRGGKIIAEMTAQELEDSCRTFISVGATKKETAKLLLMRKYLRVEEDENGFIRVYDDTSPQEVVSYLYNEGVIVNEVKTDKIGLEEYYIDLMKGKGAN